MDILRVFFWYCKENDIMSVLYDLYHNNDFGSLEFDLNTRKSFFKHESLNDFLKNRIKKYGYLDLFWDLQLNFRGRKIMTYNDERFKKAKRNWNSFVKKNLRYSDDFINVGDEVEGITKDGRTSNFIILEKPKSPSGFFKVIDVRDSSKREIILSNYLLTKVNGEKREPKYYIVKNRKTYGIDKK